MNTEMKNDDIGTGERTGADQDAAAGGSSTRPPQDASHDRATGEDRPGNHAGGADIPKTPDEYAIELPDGMSLSAEDQTALKALLPAAHSAGISNEAMTTLVTAYAQLNAATQSEMVDQLDAARDEHVATLRREWGDSVFEQRINIAKDVASNVGGKTFRELLRSAIVPGRNGKPPTYLGDHPEMIKFLSAVGSGAVKSVQENGERVRRTVQEQIDEMRKRHPVGTPGYSDKGFQRRLSALYEQLHGSGPIVGSDMRTL